MSPICWNIWPSRVRSGALHWISWPRIEEVGGHLNAYTSREHTAYYAKVLKEDAPLAVDILADILQHSTFEPDELARERSVVLQEIGQAHDTPDDVVFDHFQAPAFPDQPLGRPVLGDAERVRGMSRESIMGYMDEPTAPGSMVLSAAGMIEHDHLVALASHLFGDLPTGGRWATKRPRIVAATSARTASWSRCICTVVSGASAMHDPTFTPRRTVGAVRRRHVVAPVPGNPRDAGAGLFDPQLLFRYSDCGLFGIYAGTGEEEIAELMPVLADEVRRLAGSLDEGEVRRARNQLKAGTLMSLESTASRAEQLGEQMLVFGRPLPIDEIVARIDAVDVEAVRRVANRIFTGHPSLAAIGPLGRMMPYDGFAERLSS